MGAQTMGSQGGVQCHSLTGKGSSLYSLTLDEVENQLGNSGKPLRSMNLDELLKTVCSVEASQGMTSNVGKQSSQLASSSSVPCQSNLVVSREFSCKTVNEVWNSIQDGRRKNNQTGIGQEQQITLGEMTLENFLAKAGIVSGQARDTHSDIFGDDEQGEWTQYQLSTVGQTQSFHPKIGPTVSGFHSNDRCLLQPMHTGVSHIMDVAYPETQSAVLMSPTRNALSDTQTLGRKRVAPGEVVEKTVERRQKRMIKNRESAARSRARRQAYTNELENKITYLEKEIEMLKKQQAVEKEMQCVPPPEPKPTLRRTKSGTL